MSQCPEIGLREPPSQGARKINIIQELYRELYRNYIGNYIRNYAVYEELYKELDSKPLFSQVSNISLENQPSAKAPKMKSIQMILYSYFVMKSHEGVLKIDN